MDFYTINKRKDNKYREKASLKEKGKQMPEEIRYWLGV